MKRLLLTITSLVIAASAFAQVGVGVRAGFNTANMAGAFDKDYSKSILGVYAGAFADFALPQVTDGFGIRAEFDFSLQGGGEKYEDDKAAARMNFIQIPVMAEYKILDGQVAFMLGPQFDFCISGKEVYKDEDNKLISKLDSDLYNGFVFDMVAGADIMVTENIGVQVRYNFGLSNAFPKKGKNRVLQVGAVYVF